MSETGAVNLPEALMQEKQGIHQALLNVQHSMWGGGNAPFESPYNWPNPGTVVYVMGGAFHISFRNIHVADYGDIAWSEEHPIGTPKVERVEVPVKVAKGDTLRDTISHTFGEVETLEKTTALNFASTVEARLGSLPVPVSASLQEKVDRQFSEKFGHQKTHAQTETQDLTIVGPADRTYIFERKSTRAQRTTKCQPLFDYTIEVSFDYDNGTRRWMDFPDRDTFERFCRGLTDDSVGVPHRRFKKYPVLGIGNPTWHEETLAPLAPWFRERANPHYQIGHHAAPLEWVDTYDSVLVQSVTYVENA